MSDIRQHPELVAEAASFDELTELCRVVLPRNRTPRGSRSKRPYTEEELQHARHRLAQGMTLQEIARDFDRPAARLCMKLQDRFGDDHTELTRIRGPISKSRMSKPRQRNTMAQLPSDPEWQRKFREGIARRSANPEWQENVRKGVKKRLANPESRQNHHEAMIRMAADPEWRRKNREQMAQVTTDPEWRRKQREGAIRNAANPEWLHKQRENGKRLAANHEWRQKMREVAFCRSANPDYRQKLREAALRREADRRVKRIVLCSVGGCGKAPYSLGLCRAHYTAAHPAGHAV